MNVEKKPPAWATVVGILGITFGAFGLMGGAYELMMPMMLAMQTKVMEGMKETIKEQPQTSEAKPGAPKVNPDKMFEAMQDFMSGPPWYERFAYVNGALQLVLSALYILASIFLLLVRRGAATLFVWIAGISAVRNLVAIGAGISAGSFLAFWSVTSGSAGFLIDLVLIIVVAVSDRTMYRA